MTTFDRNGRSSPQVVLNFGDEEQYLIGLDGSGQHQVNMGDYCLGPAAVTADGKWIACVSSPDGDNGYDRLQLAALHPGGTSQVRQLHQSREPFYSNLAWSPNGQYLAVVLADVGLGCSVDIYASPAPHTTLTWAVHVTSSWFSIRGFCAISDLTWSADGQQLQVLGYGTAIFLARVNLTPLLQAFAGTPAEQAIAYEVPVADIQTYTLAQVTPDPAVLLLSPQGDRFLVAAWTPTEHLMSFNLQTNHLTSLFALPVINYRIRAATWTSDGHQFLVAVGTDPCVDCSNYAISDVYLYSPPVVPESSPTVAP
jgi:hypothetical protein